MDGFRATWTDVTLGLPDNTGVHPWSICRIESVEMKRRSYILNERCDLLFI